MESCQFFRYRGKQVIIQLEIQPKTLESAKNKIVTDKYIDYFSWEYIYNRLKRLIVAAQRNNENEPFGDNFTINDLAVSCDVVNRDEGYLNYAKLAYEFEWIIKVKIAHAGSSQNGWMEQASSSSKSVSNGGDSDEIINVEGLSQENKKMRMSDDEPGTSMSKVPNPFKLNVTERKNKSRQSTMNQYLGQSNKPKMKDLKVKIPKTSVSKENKPSSDAVETFNTQQVEKMKAFVEESEQQELKNQRRKEELKNLKIRHCQDLTNDQIINAVRSLDNELGKLIEQDSLQLRISGILISPVDITTSKIMSEDQILLIMREITNIHSGIDDNVLSEVLLPYVLIEIFKNKLHMSTEEALKRIKMQEEKRRLNREDFDESY